MKTIEALLQTIEQDAPVRDVTVGSFWTAVVIATDPVRCGLAASLRSAGHPDGPAVQSAGALLDRSARDLASLLRSPSTLEASIGMAAFNALLDVDVTGCVDVSAEQVILERGAGRNVAVVGHFHFIERIRQSFAQCWVLEQRPREGDVPAERAAEFLPLADVVAITGTSLINHTFDGLMEMCPPGAYVIALGPSAPLSPVLLDVGLDAVCGTVVTDATQVQRSVRQGATFRQIKGVGGVRLVALQK